MTYLKTHYSICKYGNSEAQEAWKREGLIPDKVKFCDGLMLPKSRQFDFTRDVDGVDCLKCRKKIDDWCKNGFDIPD